MHSADITKSNIDKIAELFPNCITETADENGKLKKAINFETLHQMLSEDVAEGDEAYEFTWVGKKEAIVKANKPIRKTLRPCKDGSVDWDTTENLYIEGDNLKVLKLLQESYLGKVKMIYIDPPYNTGSDRFVYTDDFRMTKEEYKEFAEQIDENGNVLFKENTESNPHFHSVWCSMIYSRLMLARNLLSDDGVIFISIDDNEYDNMKKICDEVFGNSSFIANMIWQKKTGASDATHIATITEYIIVYAKDITNALIQKNQEALDVTRYKYKDEYYEERGPFYYDSLDRGTLGYHETLDYGVIAPDGTEVFPNGRTKKLNDGWRWKWGKEKLKWGIDNGFIEVKRAENKECGWGVYYKIYLRVDNNGKKIEKSSPYKNLIQNVLNTHAALEAKQIFSRTDYFSNPKPVDLIKFLSLLGTEKDSIILDFFSGSATTAHSVMQLNAEDGGHRKFIMVQIPEETPEKSEAYKAGYKNICEIGKERIRRAGKKIKEENPDSDFDCGFRVLKIDESNMTDVYYSPLEINQQMLLEQVENIKPDRTDLDLLFGCLIDWGIPLNLPYVSENIDGCNVHTYNDGDLIACFDKNVPESVIREIAKRQPLRAVFRDSSFADSPAKINVEEIFKMIAPDTRVRVI